MNRFLMSVYHYFSGEEYFTIDAKDKKDAVEKGRLWVRQSSRYYGGNYNLNDVKCIKKLNPGKKAQNENIPHATILI